MTESFPLPLLRIWCRKNDAWLSFRSLNQDNYFVSAGGYFVEIPGGNLAPITARVAFPVINGYPAVALAELDIQPGFSPPSPFVYALKDGPSVGPPQALSLQQVRQDLDSILPSAKALDPSERYIAVRVLESGLMPEHELTDIIGRLSSSGRTLGQQLINGGIFGWEMLLTLCLDTRAPDKLDPPSVQGGAYLREWELAGEILITMGSVRRTQLEEAVRIKREAARLIGEILVAMGACTRTDVEKALIVQGAIRQVRGSEVASIGELLLKNGFITQAALDEAMARQRQSMQSLDQILINMGACTAADVKEYEDELRAVGAVPLDDVALGNWLLKKRKVSLVQLQQGLDVYNRGREMLGEILVEMGACTHEHVQEAIQIQREIREAHKAGMERLGAILLSQRKIEANQLEEALAIQNRGRRPLGQILVNVCGCGERDLATAVALQQQWRERISKDEDRLGDVLIRRGFLTEENLAKAMEIHKEKNKPLGRILVEEEMCTPEQIIATLVMRDYKRQSDLFAFVKKAMQIEMPGGDLDEQTKRSIKDTTERLISTWFPKHAPNT